MLIKIKSYAKINLILKIIGRCKKTNFHLLESLIKKISLHDEIEIEFKGDNSQKKNIEFIYAPYIKNSVIFQSIDNKNNLISRAIDFFEQETGIDIGKIYIKCKKNIPFCAGLGGGSSNAAYILKFLEKHFEKKLKKESLKKIAAKLGSDVLLFFSEDELNEAIFLEGIGDSIKIIPYEASFENYAVLIIYPHKSFETAHSYQKYQNSKIPFDEKIDIKNLDPEKQTYNIFRKILQNDEKFIIENILEKISKFEGFICGNLSGSGCCCFGIFENKKFAQEAYDLYREQEKDNYFLNVCHFI